MQGSMNGRLVVTLITSTNVLIECGWKDLKMRAVIDLIPDAASLRQWIACVNSFRFVSTPSVDGGHGVFANGAAGAGGDCFISICLANSSVACNPATVWPCALLISAIGANSPPFFRLMRVLTVCILMVCGGPVGRLI